MDVTGRHAVVTGGGRGIGLAIANALAQRGAKVSIVGRSVLNAAEHAPFLRAEADVSEVGQIARAFAACRKANGPIEILINNSGVSQSAPLAATSDDLWYQTLAVNLTGTFLCMRAVAPEMLEAGFGRIVNVASVAGLEGAPYIAAYCASKHGVVGLTRAAAAEYAGKGVTVNAVCPGYVDTAMTDASVAHVARVTRSSEEEARARLAALNGSGRLIEPGEVAAAVTALCESTLTGQTPVLT